MLAAERHEKILAAVRANGTVRLTDLAARLAVTPVTVRRDVTVLADRGLLERVHGGVTLPRRGVRPGSAESAPTHSAFGVLAAQTLIGMVTPSVDYYWPQVIQGAQAATVGAAGRLALRGSSYDPAEDRRQVTRLLERGVRGLLVAPTTEGKTGLDLLRWLGSLTIPVVLMERVPPPELPTLGLDAVVTAHSLGAGLAVRHLVTLGHQRVGLVTTRHSPTSRALRSGWAQACAALELPASPDETVRGYGSPGWPEEYDALVWNCLDAGVRALLVHADREAIGIVERARDLGLTVPGDLAVVAYDDEVAAAADPPLTAVRTPRHRLGAVAVELALARVADTPDRPVHQVELWPMLMVRESCGASLC
jgi:DNA-binding LacI/PurR family transcriptional regulator